MQIVIDIPEDDYCDILQYAELKVNKEFENLMIVAIKNGTPIPDNATNGDVLKAMFPNIVVEEQSKDLFIVFNMDFQGTPFYKVWWDAPYQKGE